MPQSRSVSLFTGGIRLIIISQALADLIALARTHGVFARYAPRITLHHAHLAHALGQSTRALTCYAVAVQLTDPATVHSAEAGADADFIHAAALAGGVLLRIGLAHVEEESELPEELIATGHAAAKECRGMGGTLEATGRIVEACLAEEILRSK